MISAATPILLNHLPNPLTNIAAPESSSEQPSPAAAENSSGADELSISQPSSLATDAGFRQRTSLRIQNRTKLRINDDGQLTAKSKTKLRFRYEFEGDNGTRIQIRAKANLSYTQTSDGSESSTSIKFRAKFQISVVQQDVSSGIAPLLETPELPEAAQQIIAEALGLFQQITDAATEQFLESDPLDGDRLISELVEAFNNLADAVNLAIAPAPTDPVAGLPAEGADLPDSPAPIPTDVINPEPFPAPVDNGIEPLPVPPTPETTESDDDGQVEAVSEENVESAQEVAPGDSAELAADAAQTQEISEATDIPGEESQQKFVESILVKARLRVIQSLSHLVDGLESDSSSGQSLRVDFKATARFFAHYDFSGVNRNEPHAGGNHIDTQG